MSTSTPNGASPSFKKRSAADPSDTRKRTRTSPSAQDPPTDETPVLRGGGSTFTPAAGTWQRPTTMVPGQGRLHNNLGKVPLTAELGFPALVRQETANSAVREQAEAGTQTNTGTQTNDGTQTSAGTQTNDGTNEEDKGGPPKPRKSHKPEKRLPRSGRRPKRGRGGSSPSSSPSPKRRRGRRSSPSSPSSPPSSPSGPGPDGDWGYPDPRWNTDRQILDNWANLERLIARYVNEVIVDSIPDIDTTHEVFPYEGLCKLSHLAGPIVRNDRYARYIFQLSIWNIVNEKFLSHMATEWACEEKGTHQWGQRTKGLAGAMDLLTYDQSMDPRTTVLRRDREKWYIWRKDTVDVVYGWLSRHTDYEKTVENAIFDILAMYQGHFKPAFAAGDRQSWDNLVWRTTEIVALAAQLSIMMRRSQDGTWSPFIPMRLSPVRLEAMMRHQDTEASLPPGQTETTADSTVTLTVVPGLSKYTMTNVDDDPDQPGVQNTAIRKIVRVKAKCLFDLTEAQTGERRDGDVWVAEDP